MPRPIPSSSVKPSPPSSLPAARVDGLQQAFGALRRNEWAWTAFGTGALALLLIVIPGIRPLTVSLAVAGILAGLVGEYKSGDWQRGGSGRNLARAGILVSAIDLVILALL